MRRMLGRPRFGLRIQPSQLRVVVQHLLEVRHVPVGIDRVPVEATADVVVDAAACHPVQGRREHLVGALPASGATPKQEFERHRLRELRGAAEPAPLRVEGRTQGVERAAQHLHVARGGRRRRLRGALQDLQHTPALLVRDLPAFPPGIRNALEHAPEGRHPVPILFREVRPGEERRPVG